MDPSRHHEFIGSNEDRSRAVPYYSREAVPDLTSHRYYGPTMAAQQAPPPQQQPQTQPNPTRSLSNTRKPCDCTTTPSGSRITCNGCRLNPPDDIWPPMATSTSNSVHEQHTQRGGGDYRQMVNDSSMRSAMRQSPMFMQTQHAPPPAPPPHQQQIQQQPAPTQALTHGPPSTQSLVQSHPSHVGNRSNYWPPNPSSTSQHYAEEQLALPPPHHHQQQQQQHTGQATSQTQIDISITRRTAAPTGMPAVDGSMYGQYKSASITATASHPSHSSSSYPLPTSSNPLHQRVSAMGGSGPIQAAAAGSGSHYITKERIYEHTKYSSTTTTTKIAYNSTTSSAIYDNHHPMNNQAPLSNKASLPIDHHVINPSNLPASKEQHPSPNYARKCPQMYTAAEAEQSTAHHHHLYMPTPQFSSDKFSRASPQQMQTDYTKLRESPLQTSATAGSPYMMSNDNKYNHLPPNHLRESPQFMSQQQHQQQQQQPQTIPRNSNPYYAVNQNPSKVHPPEMSPIIMKQSHTHYQYSKSPLPPPLPPSAANHHHQMHQIPPAKANSTSSSLLAPPLTPTGNPGSAQRYIVDNVKREDLEIYENPPMQQSARNPASGIYINPYNTPPPTGDSCCKEVTPLSASSSPYTTGSATPNYRVESPQFYPAKYGKMSMNESGKQHSLINQNTPPPSRAPSQRGHQQPSYYYEGNMHSAPSPAAATAASPSPSALLSSTTTSQTQIHHTEYVTTLQGGPPAPHIGPPPSGHALHQGYPPTQPTAQHQSTTAAYRNSGGELVMASQNASPYERGIPHPHSQIQAPANKHMALTQSSSVPVQSAVHHASKMPAKTNAPNKHKPNYRELLNHSLAMRNATSEEELNLQIIKKTLNVDVRGPAGSQPPVMPNSRGAANLHQPVVRETQRSEMSLIQPAIKPSMPSSSSSVLVNNNAISPQLARPESSRICIKQEDDKPSPSSTTSTTFSPLDLSMRTVKTKADSTEYKYQQRRLTPSSTANEVGRYTLPRVDATPVFSVHAFEPSLSNSNNVASNRSSSQNSRHNSTDSRRNYTPPTQPSTIQPPTAQTGVGSPYGQQGQHVNVNTSHGLYAARRTELSAATVPTKSSVKAYESSCVIKTAPKPVAIPVISDRDVRLNMSTSQARPSVLESNPYASVIKSEPKRIVESSSVVMGPAVASNATQAATSTTTQHTLAAVERLPPDTSIMALPPRNSAYSQSRPVQTASPLYNSSSSTSSSIYAQGCDRNPNFRKRHIQEYSSEISAGEPSSKQIRHLDVASTSNHNKSPIAMRPADISVIAVNESNKHEMLTQNSLVVGVIASTTAQATSKVIVNNHSQSTSVVVCKQEPLTPTSETPPKMEKTPVVNQPVPANSQMFAARFKTKAELKGFTFNPRPVVQAENAIPPAVVAIKQEEELPVVKVKEEPNTLAELPTIPGLEDDFGKDSLLDFGWSNTCNNFVEQLLTRPAKKKTTPIAPIVAVIKTIKEADMVVSSTDISSSKKPLENPFPKDIANSKKPLENQLQKDIAASKKPLEGLIQKDITSSKNPLENHLSNMESAADTTRSSFARMDGLESSVTMKSSMNQDPLNTSTSSGIMHKKLTKIEREKKRFQQEKRLAERLLAKDSSSESEDELNKRKTERLKKPLMKAKLKLKSGSGNSNDNSSSTQLTDKNRFSDCGCDSSSETEKDAKLDVTNGNSKTAVSSPKDFKKEKVNDKPVLKKDSNEKCDKVKKEKEDEKKKTTATSSKDIIIRVAEDANKNKRPYTNEQAPTVKKPTQVKAAIKKTTDKSSSSSSADDNDDDNEDDDDEEVVQRPKKILKSSINAKKYNNTTKSKFKVGLNTMTRSKLKKEMEMQLANSKVLRNDKIIRNSTTKIKRKYVRKYVNNITSYLESGGLSRESGVMKSTRLKAKLERKGCLQNLTKKDKKLNKAEMKEASMKNSKNENVHDPSVLELYRFKRALKVPPSLINIKHPGHHKIAASLPDLERHAEALEAYAKKKKIPSQTKMLDKLKTNKILSSGSTKKTNADEAMDLLEPRSIIDVLHSKVTKASGLNVRNKTTTTIASKPNKICSTTKSYASNNCGMFSETSQTTESSELQMLPPLIKEETEEDDDDDNESANGGKKRHFSIFDTKVLPTKTRTESKMQQKRENIREIFVGEDRPASAPPEMIQAPDDEGEKMTYEQKYEQFLQQMNIVISADKFGRFGRTAAARKLNITPGNAMNIKEEVDTESTSVMDPDELKDDQKSDTNRNQLRKKRGKYLRRKGSSGFDYIRKKKKPTSSAISALHNHNSTNSSFHQISIKAEKMEIDEYENKVKTEDDVSREIQKWVLNKGVGQSTMHKAARQGYIDVIVYCLERMAMNPDQKDNAGYTPLHEACTNGWLDIARVLLRYGANHSAAAHSGIRPLHEASENDNEEMARLLLSYGADPLLATYSGQTPLMLASSPTMRDILNNHLRDVQSMGPDRKPWKFAGPWEIYDESECGYNVFEGAPNSLCDMSRALLRKGSLTNNLMLQNKKLQQQHQQNVLTTNNITTTTTTTSSSISNTTNVTTIAANTCNTASNENASQNGPTSSGSSSCSNITNMAKGIETSPPITTTTTMTTTTTTTMQQQQQQQQKGETTTKTVMDKCAVVLDKIDRFNSVRLNNNDNKHKSEILVENSDSDGEMFEFEEADILLPPLYLLKDEGTTDKWVLLSDLCNLLKVKSKDTLLNKIYPSSSSVATAHKGLMRELKMSDFLEKATCLQLLCAGEKINICASKVVLIKYNENVRNLLGVKTILMKF